MMREGDLVVDRFEIRGLAGHGGMGAVYKAKDRTTGQPVALKVLAVSSAIDEARFLREARVLAELSHPAIVKYVAHGVLPTGAPFLAMEWLDGEDLAIRLARKELDIDEALVIARRVAGALADSHRKGIIHRDIKPSNLFLVDKRPDQVKAVDFGLARLALPSRAMTHTGAVIGTLGYMAPEQARGERDLDARTDVFALGCVLFECLTGRPAFSGPDVVAVLVKILSGKAPRVREEHPELPEALDELLAKMMNKEREGRLEDGTAVLACLEDLGDLPGVTRRHDSRAPKALSRGEQRMLSIILIAEGSEEELYTKATLTPEQIDDHIEPIQRLVKPVGGEVAPLANGTVLTLLKGRSTASDQASRAATCALAIFEAMPGCKVALATGPAEVTGQWPEGQVIDRAARLLKAAQEAPDNGVYIDEVTTGLLDMRFDVETSDHTHLLHGERAATGGRLLLGRPTPCVGRTKELTFLDGMFSECVAESTASAVLVTGNAGIGKSRLAMEFLERIRTRDVATILIARGDPVSAGSALAVASQLVRYAARVRQGDSPQQHQRLRAYLSRYFQESELVRVAEFLGELIHSPTDEEPSPQLRAARNDARIMSEQLRCAFVDWIGALCDAEPLLIVIEDLHWGDLPTVNLLEGALRRNAQSPLFVLALARPEVVDIFPKLWDAADVHGLQLGALKRRAAETLVRSVLGDGVDEQTIDRIVTQAGGNAFYLEELIRHVAVGGTSTFPETVLAIAQSRLDALNPELRRVLRAAAVFGDVHWEAALRSLLGNAMVTADLTDWIAVLLEQEILEPGQEGRFPGQRELNFRHDLLREAAYSMLTEQDRKLGHRLAAEWLESAGEQNALTLAEHYVKGGEPRRAIPYFTLAAQTALDGGHLDAAIEIAKRGLDCEAQGEERGTLRLVQMMGHAFRNQFSSMAVEASEALNLLIPGSTSWFQALAGMAGVGSWGGDPMSLMMALQSLQGFRGELKDIGPVGYAGNIICDSLNHIGQREQADRLYQRLEETAAASASPDPVFLGWVQLTRCIRSIMGQAPLGEALPNIEAAHERFDEARAFVARSVSASAIGWTQTQLGLLEQAEATSKEALELARSLDIPLAEGLSVLYYCMAIMIEGRPEETIPLLKALLDAPNPLIVAYGRSELACAYHAAHRLDDAKREVETAVKTCTIFPIAQSHALAELAAVELEMGELEAALDHATKALKHCENAPMDQFVESVLRLTHVKALRSLGREDDARGALSKARSRLHKQADSLHLSELRDSYLQALPPNRETLELADSWLGRPEG